MFRAEPWLGIGEIIEHADTSAEVIKLANLDWHVKQAPSYIDVEGVRIPTGYTINYKDDDNSILGVVGKNYKVVQNDEAFAFTYELVGKDDIPVSYETAGMLFGGKMVWMLAKMPSTTIVGDEFERYFLFSNSHDGTSAVRCCLTNIRVVCKNTLNLALRNAKRSWRYTHAGDLASKIVDAKNTLIYANEYNKAFAKEAERLAAKKFTKAEEERLIEKLFPIPKDVSARKIANAEYDREVFMKEFNADDLQNFNKSAWKFVNAISGTFYFKPPKRATETYEDRRMSTLIIPDKKLDEMYALVAA